MTPRVVRVASQLRGGGLPLLRPPPQEEGVVVDTIIPIMEGAAEAVAAVPSAEVATTGPLVLPPILVPPPAAPATARIASQRAAVPRQFPGMAIAPARTLPSRSG
jgi:hypothetical protein